MLLVIVLLALPYVQAAAAPSAGSSSTGALVVTFNIPVDQGASNYVQKAAAAAISNNYDMIIVMNTPGGLLSDMITIVNSVQSVVSHGVRV